MLRKQKRLEGKADCYANEYRAVCVKSILPIRYMRLVMLLLKDASYLLRGEAAFH